MSEAFWFVIFTISFISVACLLQAADTTEKVRNSVKYSLLSLIPLALGVWASMHIWGPS